MTGTVQHPLFGDAILPPEWYLEHTQPPATEPVEEPEVITEEPEREPEPEQPEVITEQPTAEAITATVVTQPAATQPVETVTAAQQAAAGTVQASTAPIGGQTNDALVNALFVILPLLLVAIAVLIGLLVARKRKAAAMMKNSAVNNPNGNPFDGGNRR